MCKNRMQHQLMYAVLVVGKVFNCEHTHYMCNKQGYTDYRGSTLPFICIVVSIDMVVGFVTELENSKASLWLRTVA